MELDSINWLAVLVSAAALARLLAAYTPDAETVLLWLAAGAWSGFLPRILDYLSFMVMGFIGGLFLRRPNLVVASSPQFFAALGGWAIPAARSARRDTNGRSPA